MVIGEVVCIINTITNIFALIPIANLYNKNRILGCLLLLCSFIASCLMHMSETKHNIHPPIMQEYSNLFLNIDRVFAIGVFLYTGFLVSIIITKDSRSFNTVLYIASRFSIGLVASAIGESTSDLSLYLFFHTLWHYFAFDSVDRIVFLL